MTANPARQTVRITTPSSTTVATVDSNAPATQDSRSAGVSRARAPSAAMVPVLETNPPTSPDSGRPTRAPAARCAT